VRSLSRQGRGTISQAVANVPSEGVELEAELDLIRKEFQKGPRSLKAAKERMSALRKTLTPTKKAAQPDFT